MTQINVPTAFLTKAWFDIKKQDIQPRFTIADDYIKVTAFPKGGAGMRVSYYPIVTGCCSVTFEVSDDLRCFINKISAWPEVKLSIENKQLNISVESSTAAIQYVFPGLQLHEDAYIEDHNDDQIVAISTVDWFNMWNTVPPKGSVTICLSKQTKVITLNHSTGRWKSAVIARAKPSRDVSVIIDSGVAKSVFVDGPEQTFSELVFKHVGVLEWRAKNEKIYIAPNEKI
jgi:hypothetical protein